MAWFDIGRGWARAVVLGGLVLLAGCGGGGGGSTLAFSISVTVTGLSGSGLVLRLNSADTLPVAGNGVLTFASTLPAGAVYVVTVAATPSSPTQRCLVANGTGTVSAGNVTQVAVTCQSVTSAAYVVYQGSNTVSQYSVAADGGLTPLLPSVGIGATPNAIALDPLGRFAYVAINNGTLLEYTIAADGRLSPLRPPAVFISANPTSITVSPSGAHAYVTTPDGNVWQFAIGTDGRLGALSPANVVTGLLSPSSIAIDPSGRFGYVAHSGSQAVAQFAVGANGGLTPMTPTSVPAGLGTTAVTSDATGQFVYATNLGGGTVSNYRIGANGGLIAIGNGTVVGNQPRDLAPHPNGRDIYVANFAGDEIVLLRAGADGALVLATGVGSTAVGAPRSLSIDSTGQFAYVTTGNDTVVRYAIGADGSLSAPAVTATGVTPVAIALR